MVDVLVLLTELVDSAVPGGGNGELQKFVSILVAVDSNVAL